MIDQIARTVDLEPLRWTEELRDPGTGELRCPDWPCIGHVSSRQGVVLLDAEAAAGTVARLVPH